ncbi:hypothetical protein D9758_006996 [Tetrapyrgos nigripes]|uniref:Uncharacterized protein n=1 Tax=Tetrapyrgos nigripes TaxID=182062 RepID=A0A8H5LUR9_9AGAR|nr:hypothetical protein D9758_006996 [Tetrapyrgos nigripes]
MAGTLIIVLKGVSKKRAYPPGSPNKNVRSKTRRRVQSSDGQELIQSVFAETWAAFYAWECEYARESIKSLSSVLRTTEVLPTASARASSAEDFISAFKGLKLDSGPRPTNNVFTGFATAVCEEFLDDIECINIDIPPPGEGLSSPPYESCTPIKTSIMKGDDSHYMPFIPFADDPGFKFEYHIDRYKYTAWQQHDPDKVHKHCKADIVGVGDGDEFFDLQIITFEAACQLHNIYKLNFEQIDKANVLPLRMLTSDESPGLLDLIPKLSHPRQITKHLMPQNNLQLSPSKLVSRSPRIITSESSKVKVEVSNFISRFCHRLSCSTSYCSRHLDSSSPPLKIPPKLKKFDLSQSAAEACGDNCFLHLHLSGSVSPVYAASKEWTKDDTDILEVVLHSAPDASPCDISIICRKSCQEVFEKRTQMIPDAQVELLLKRDKKRRPVKKRRPAKRRVESFKDSNPYNFTPP